MDHRRLRTVREQTSDEWGILLMSLLRYASLDPTADRRHHHFFRRSAAEQSRWRRCRSAISAPKRCS